MNEIKSIGGSTWHVCLVVSFFLFLSYAYNRRAKAKYLHLVGIIGGVEAVLFAIAMCWQAIIGTTCYTDSFEKTCILLGAIALIWEVTGELKKLIFTSQPH